MAAAPERPRRGEERQVGIEAFERAVAAGPADAVEKNVAHAGDPDEIRRDETADHHHVARDVEPLGGEGAREAAAERGGHFIAARRSDEDELSIADLARDPREHAV